MAVLASSRNRQISTKFGFALLALVTASMSLVACSSQSPKITSASEAEFLANEYMNSGYTMWNRNGNPTGSVPSCYDGNGMWIAGCESRFYRNPVALVSPVPDSQWTYFQFDRIVNKGYGDQLDGVQCFSIIPPYGDYETQLGGVNCADLTRPAY